MTTHTPGADEFITLVHFLGPERTRLIGAAVSSAVKTNPDNPVAAAEALPELVEAVRRLLAYIEATGWHLGATYETTSEENVDFARAIVAKATGEK